MSRLGQGSNVYSMYMMVESRDISESRDIYPSLAFCFGRGGYPSVSRFVLGGGGARMICRHAGVTQLRRKRERAVLSCISPMLRMQHVEDVVLVEAHELLSGDQGDAECCTGPDGFCHLVVVTRERSEAAQELRVLRAVHLQRIDDRSVEQTVEALLELVALVFGTEAY